MTSLSKTSLTKSVARTSVTTSCCSLIRNLTSGSCSLSTTVMNKSIAWFSGVWQCLAPSADNRLISDRVPVSNLANAHLTTSSTWSPHIPDLVRCSPKPIAGLTSGLVYHKPHSSERSSESICRLWVALALWLLAIPHRYFSISWILSEWLKSQTLLKRCTDKTSCNCCCYLRYPLCRVYAFWFLTRWSRAQS